MYKVLMALLCATLLMGSSCSKDIETPSVILVPRPEIPAQFRELCPWPEALKTNPDGSMSSGQAAVNQQNSDSAVAECRRRQQGLIDAWPKN